VIELAIDEVLERGELVVVSDEPVTRLRGGAPSLPRTPFLLGALMSGSVKKGRAIPWPFSAT